MLQNFIGEKLQMKKVYFCCAAACGQCYKTFLDVIYATSGFFPYDFDWGYTDSNIITTKKVLQQWSQGVNAIERFTAVIY